MDKPATSRKVLVTAFVMLAVLASTSQAQVHQSFEVNPEPVWIFGSPPYEFTASEERRLFPNVSRAASPGVPLFNVNAYYPCSRAYSGCKVPHADFLFGPYNRTDSTFLMDAIFCVRGKSRKQWTCEPKDTWTYLHTEGFDSLVSFGSGISLEAAKTIAAYKDQDCKLPTVAKEKRADKSAVLLANHIKLNKETGVYDRRGESGGCKFRLVDEEIELVEAYSIIE